MNLTDFSGILVIDIQYVYDKKGYLFAKELCVRHVKNNVYLHSTYQPPTYFSKQEYSVKYAKSNRWTCYRHHHISVTDGVRPYNYIFLDLLRVMNHYLTGKTLIYVIGFEKVRLLKNLLCGHENSKEEVSNLAVPKDVLIIDVTNNRVSTDYPHLALQYTAEERKMYLMKRFISGQDACMFHTSYNCARLNCQYLLEKFYTVNVFDEPDAPTASILHSEIEDEENEDE
ncbi:hypothetical protein V9T40_002018 [Parthenolecanium corni]|uniref:Uncharacterized protein n=1 Tax=Parthenolecanium corni TaxID=536013 RepID=A0AAN9TFU2_9HEMI